MDKERFTTIEKKDWFEGVKIIVDEETGVQYLFASWGSAGGMTLLVDKDGKPLLAKDCEK